MAKKEWYDMLGKDTKKYLKLLQGMGWKQGIVISFIAAIIFVAITGMGEVVGGTQRLSEVILLSPYIILFSLIIWIAISVVAMFIARKLGSTKATPGFVVILAGITIIISLVTLVFAMLTIPWSTSYDLAIGGGLFLMALQTYARFSFWKAFAVFAILNIIVGIAFLAFVLLLGPLVLA